MCGKEGHYGRECPDNRHPQSSQPSANSRLVKRIIIRKKMPVIRSGQVNYTEAKEIPQGEPMMAGMFTIDSHTAYVLFDSGASHLFMSMGFVQKHNISTMAIPIAYRIRDPGAQLYVNTRSQISASYSHLSSPVHGGA
jgi:hypothetical protein